RAPSIHDLKQPHPTSPSLLVKPSSDVRRIGHPFNDGYLSITRNQHRSWYFTLPTGINLEAQAFGELIGKNPILCTRETALCEHRSCIFHLVRDQIGVDHNEIEIGSFLQELAPFGHFYAARSAG